MILVIQNGFLESHIGKYLTKEYEIIKSYNTNVNDININKYDKIIILGGPQRLYYFDHYPILQELVNFIHKCLEYNKPLLGICLGCQLLAYSLGCEIRSFDKLNVGYDTCILDYQHLFRCHHDYIVPNDKIIILSTFQDIVYLFQYKNCIGIQCHPDIPPEVIKEHKLCQHDYQISYPSFIEVDRNNQELLSYLLKKIEN
jgi:GMP synthase-like glutamine amidotransferase